MNRDSHLLKYSVTLAAALAVGAINIHAVNFAEGAEKDPAKQNVAASLQVTIVEITGNVQVRDKEDSPWQSAKVGMVVNEGAEFRTGPRSSVTCTIPPDQAFTLDRLGTVKVATAIQAGKKVKTEMVMKYGRTKYSIEAAGLEHESTISSPTGTMAVRGTRVSLYDQVPYTPQAISYTGHAHYVDANRSISVGSKDGGLQSLMVNRDSPADSALFETFIDPAFGPSRSREDLKSLLTLFGHAGLPFSQHVTLDRPNIEFAPFTTDAALAKSLVGNLDIVARWSGQSHVNMQVLVDLRNPKLALLDHLEFRPSEFLTPAVGLDSTASGGVITSSSAPTGGMQVANWRSSPKTGTFAINAQLLSGEPVDLTLNAYYRGKKQFIYFNDANGNLVRSQTFRVNLSGNGLTGSPKFYLPSVDKFVGVSVPAVGDGATPKPVGGGFVPGNGSGGNSGNNGNSGNSGNSGASANFRRPR